MILTLNSCLSWSPGLFSGTDRTPKKRDKERDKQKRGGSEGEREDEEIEMEREREMGHHRR